MAQLSKAAYEGGTPPEGWQALTTDEISDLGLDPAQFSNSKNGFSSTLFQNAETGEYVLAFRGTDQLLDWGANIKQAFGGSAAQYDLAISLGGNVNMAVGGNVTFVGHSLGGGLASAASIVTGQSAYTFNAAGLHSNTIAPFGVSPSDGKSLIRAYYVRGEPLSLIQDFTPLPNAAGTRIGLSPGGWLGHGMNSVLGAMGP